MAPGSYDSIAIAAQRRAEAAHARAEIAATRQVEAQRAAVELSEATSMMAARRRPNPLHWLGYVFGLGLPARNKEWVLYDVTCPSWVWRHIARAVLQLAVPVVLVLIIIPAPLWVRILTDVAAGGPALMFSIGYMFETTDHRLTKAGFPAGYAEKVRKARAAVR